MLGERAIKNKSSALIIFLFLSQLIASCAKYGSINFKSHELGQVPQKIIWLQIAGLDPEHLAMLRFDLPEISLLTAFEESTCQGQIWNFNIFDMRPPAHHSFLSQLTGRMDIKGECSDFGSMIISDHLKKISFKNSIFEIGTSAEESLYPSKNFCPEEKKEKLIDVTYWSMGLAPEGHKTYFHSQEKENFIQGTHYFDRSCQRGECSSKYADNVISVFERFQNNNNYFLYLVRDFEYKKKLENKKMAGIYDHLKEVEKLLSYFQAYAKSHRNTLVLVTSASARPLEMPPPGIAWEKYRETNEAILFKRNSLLSPVFAFGARAENFCGLFEESQVLKRITEAPVQGKYEYYFINPF
jgi:hypothetical protein